MASIKGNPKQNHIFERGSSDLIKNQITDEYNIDTKPINKMESNDKKGDAAFLTKTNIVSGNNKWELLPISLPSSVLVGLNFQDNSIHTAEVIMNMKISTIIEKYE